jgi:hypothetical protein
MSQGLGGSGGGGNGAAASSGGVSGFSGTVNTGGGGGGGNAGVNGGEGAGAAGGSGIVILRYPSIYTITIGAGLSGSTATVGNNKVTVITAGTGNVSWA